MYISMYAKEFELLCDAPYLRWGGRGGQGAGCRVQGAGCRVQGAECRVPGGTRVS